MIGMNEGKVKVNFGNKKFMFNIEESYQGIQYNIYIYLNINFIFY